MMDCNLLLYWKVINWRGKSTVLYPTNEETPRSAGSILYPNYRIAGQWFRIYYQTSNFIWRFICRPLNSFYKDPVFLPGYKTSTVDEINMRSSNVTISRDYHAKAGPPCIYTSLLS
jgi:hypothetical protein